MLGENPSVLENFLNNAHKYCFALVPANFISFSISSSICEKMNDLLKQRMPMSKNLGAVLNKSYELCQFNSKKYLRKSIYS